MTYTPDLEPYDYQAGAPDALAVGWLDSSAPFTTGRCPDDVRRRLAELAEHPVRLMRAFHHCQFCETAPSRPGREDANLAEAADVAHSNGEIWVASPSGTNLAAPALVSHYVDVHNYLPPDVFLDAVRLGSPVAGVSD